MTTIPTASIRAALVLGVFLVTTPLALADENASGSASAAATEGGAFTEAEKAEIGQIMRDYLVANPDVLVEAVDALNAMRESEQTRARSEAIASIDSQLADFPEGAIIGNPDADVTIVEFFDYNCGYCEKALADMEAVLAADKDVRFILKEIPVLGPGSVGASRVSLAVREVAPSSYGDFHRQLLGIPGPVDETRALDLAGDLDLPLEEIRTRMNSPEVGETLAQVNAMAEQLAVFGTPSYVVGDAVIEGAVGAEALNAAIANVRECGSARCS